MTAIRSDRPVKRETGTVYRGRPLVAEMHAGYISLREKGRRAGVTVDYRAIYELGWKIIAREERAKRALSHGVVRGRKK